MSNEKRENDQVIKSVQSAVNELIKLEKIDQFFPQVGSNIVYSREGAESKSDVAALTGRMISSVKGPLVCGEVVYGASKYLASVVIAAQRLDVNIRAALNLKVDENLTRKLCKAGLSHVTIMSKTLENECPVTLYINESSELFDVYIHPGDYGVEPTTTILSETPQKLLEVMREILSLE